MKRETLTITLAAALLVATNARASDEDWTFVPGATSYITNAMGWSFGVTANGTQLTVGNCAAWPTPPDVLPFAAPVNNGAYTIVATYCNRTTSGGILGNGRSATSLTLPSTLTYIDEYTFNGCTGFTGPLTLPAALTHIGAVAFNNCSGFTGSLTIPDSVTTIEESAFALTSFQSISTPSTGVSFGANAFGTNLSLETVYFRGGYPAASANIYGDAGGWFSTYAVSWVSEANIASWDPHVTPAGGLTANGIAEWEGREIRTDRSWTYTPGSPSVITHTSGWEFEVTADGDDLTVTDCLAAPAAARELNFNHPFVGGERVIAITSPRTTGGGILGANSAKASSLVLPDTLRDIGDYAFFYCVYLTGPLAIPGGVTNIGMCAFYYCNKLTGDIAIPGVITALGDYAFYNCASFTNLTFGGARLDLETIGDYAFVACTGLTGSLTIPDGVRVIGDRAFADCTGLDGALTIGDDVEIIGDRAFVGCSGIKGPLTLGGSVRVIGDYVFYVCSDLAGGLTLGDSVETIGEAAFLYCAKLTGPLVLPDTLGSIGDSAFNGCTGFTGRLTIPASVTNIGTSAFFNTRFPSIKTPSTGVKFGGRVFGANIALTEIIYTGLYPDAVGADFYGNGTGAFVSYVTAENAQDWETRGDVTGGPIADGAATWWGKAIRIGNPWVGTGGITVIPGAPVPAVELAWATNGIPLAGDYAYAVYTSTNLVEWVPLRETDGTLSIERLPGDALHRATLDATLPTQFFKVRAEK
ncbi:MAG: leucine-rich repeat domain-containing protein [Kiritimatiellaeota bacterium]|nr:leucine-rich repeat domain-containing protein [Kiritimatiellota bacterium]